MAKYKVVMVRHGDSEWNKHNRFCGWYDASLSDIGASEAARCGRALKDGGFQFDVAFTSFLKRPQQTLDKILSEIGQEGLPTERSWRLNERHYGNLTGLNKAETAMKYGEAQVKIWRRDFVLPPPPIEPDNPYYESIMKDPRYLVENGGPGQDKVPCAESLSMVIDRLMPYWTDTLIPAIGSGKRVLIVAHGSSLRGIIKHLEGLTDAQITETNVPTGIPFVYELDADFKAVKEREYLGSEEEVRAAIEKIKNQGKAKK